MKKYTRTILALILAVVSALALPINAGATALSGAVGNNTYVVHWGGSFSNLYNDASCHDSTHLYLDLEPVIYKTKGVSGVYWGTIFDTMETLSGRSLSYNKTYLQVRSTWTTMPYSGYFDSCTFNIIITNTSIVSNDYVHF